MSTALNEAVTLVSSKLWRSRKGADLVRLNDGAPAAVVIPSECDADKLDDLAEACVAAAEVLRIRAGEDGP